jgi:hypothetical protein
MMWVIGRARSVFQIFPFLAPPCHRKTHMQRVLCASPSRTVLRHVQATTGTRGGQT